MPPASREPWDLQQWMARRLDRANVPDRGQVHALLLWGAWNLEAAQLGWDVYRQATPAGDQNLTGHPLHVVEIAAESLVFRGVVSAMDQCAAAVFRLPVPGFGPTESVTSDGGSTLATRSIHPGTWCLHPFPSGFARSRDSRPGGWPPSCDTCSRIELHIAASR
jgi:hypothetical protein